MKPGIILMALIGVFSIYRSKTAWETGTLTTRYGAVNRSDSPLAFRIYCLSKALLGSLCLIVAITVSLKS